ncbi:MAG: methyltransferase domain-containing protein [Actinobacteria bacterium]|nr:methyltransferase domain-containing protein [Actinomycetota bacterium]MDI6831763.1 methyltransferase domain-containing protein [Actinomycetota bacterium]
MGPSRWEEVAEDYNRIFRNDRPYWEVLETLAESAALQAGEVVLDVGCGTGNVTALLRERFPGARVCGVDPSSNMVRLAEDRFRADPMVEIREGEGIGIPYPDGYFDCVVSNLALHHVPPPQRCLCASELARVTMPGGRLVYSDLFWDVAGERDDPARMREVIEEIAAYALHCLDIGAPEMTVFLCQQLPLHLEEKNEYVATVNDWIGPLEEAGFEGLEIVLPPPPHFSFKIIRGTRSGL